MHYLVKNIVEFLVYCIGFAIGLDLVFRIGEPWMPKPTGEANSAATATADPVQSGSDGERRQSKRRELLIALLTVAMAIVAYKFILAPRPGFLVAAGTGAIFGVANLIARAIMKDKP